MHHDISILPDYSKVRFPLNLPCVSLFSKFCESLSYVVSNIIKIDAIVESGEKQPQSRKTSIFYFERDQNTPGIPIRRPRSNRQ